MIRAAMDQIARQAFYGVTDYKYQQKVQVALAEQAEAARQKKIAAIQTQYRAEQEEIQEELGEQWLYNNAGDIADVAWHGVVNFGGGIVNGASSLVNGLSGVVNWGNNTCASLHLCVDIPDIPAIPAVPIWGDYDLYRWSSYAGSATLQVGVVVASGGIGAGGMGADATTALANASGLTLVKAGWTKVSGLLNIGKTGAEATTLVTEGTATVSLAADFTAGTERATAALAQAEHNAQVASGFISGTERANAAIAQAQHNAQVASRFQYGTEEGALTLERANAEVSLFATASDEAVFWSGFGEQGPAVAEAWTDANWGATIDQVVARSGVDLPAYAYGDDLAAAIWRDVSANYAVNASGNVTFLEGPRVSPGSVWSTTEFPALTQNTAVTGITRVSDLVADLLRATVSQ